MTHKPTLLRTLGSTILITIFLVLIMPFVKAESYSLEPNEYAVKSYYFEKGEPEQFIQWMMAVKFRYEKDISELKGLKDLTHLTYLNLSRNKITRTSHFIFILHSE